MTGLNSQCYGQTTVNHSDSVDPVHDKWANSRRLLRRSAKTLVGGVSSPFRAKAPIPLFLADARGSRITDVDGNSYIDYALGWGPLILGHRHPKIVEAVSRQAHGPHIYGAQHELEYQVSEAIHELVPCAERVAFTSSGSEAVQIALRLARGFTGRDLILKFEGHYHGWMDSVLLSYKPSRDQIEHAAPLTGVLGSEGQVRNATDNVLIVPWNDPDVLAKVFDEHGPRIAGVISEPVLCNSGCLLPQPGYLEKLASIARANGALLIFDEVITGFRLDPGGAQAHYGIVPDLATFGKALGGGLAMSAIAGRAAILDLIADGIVVFGGTFNGNPLSLAAALTTIQELAANNGQILQEANAVGEFLMHGLSECAAARKIPLTVSGFGTAFALHFTTRRELRDYRDTLDGDKEFLRQFILESARQGVNMLPDGRMYVSAAHSKQDAQDTIEAMDRAFQQLAA